MKEKHLKHKVGTPKKKPVSNILSKVFERLYRDNLEVAKPYIDIGFAADYFKDQFPLNEGHDAAEVIRRIFSMLAVEHTPAALINKVCSFERSNADVSEFRDASYINSQFSVLILKKFWCPKRHLSKILLPSMGLILRGPEEGEALQEIMAAYFAKKISTIECNQCKRVNTENGVERMTVIKFPEYLILYIDALDKNGLLKRPIKSIETAIDIACFAEPDQLAEGEKIKYVLAAIMAHPQNEVREKGVYQAIVKKKVEGEKKRQWVKFHKKEQKIVSESKALKHPAHILFYQLSRTRKDKSQLTRSAKPSQKEKEKEMQEMTDAEKEKQAKTDEWMKDETTGGWYA
jgi:hypothetical protein